jgi:hypothetical protein
MHRIIAAALAMRLRASWLQVDNLMLHEVTNSAEEARVHLVMDVAEQPVPERLRLQVGQSCLYTSNIRDKRMTPSC